MSELDPVKDPMAEDPADVTARIVRDLETLIRMALRDDQKLGAASLTGARAVVLRHLDRIPPKEPR